MQNDCYAFLLFNRNNLRTRSEIVKGCIVRKYHNMMSLDYQEISQHDESRLPGNITMSLDYQETSCKII